MKQHAGRKHFQLMAPNSASAARTTAAGASNTGSSGRGEGAKP